MTKKPSFEVLRYVDLPSALREVIEFSPEEAAALAEVNQRVAAGRTLAEVMDFLFEHTRAVFPCDRVALAFLDEDGERVVSHWLRADYEEIRLGPGYAEELRGSSLERVIASGEPRIISDLESYLAAKPSSRSTRLLVEEGVRSSMTCPLTVEGRNVGLLFRSSRRPNAYDERQVRLHLALAERLAQAVEKAWRIEQLGRANAAYLEMLSFVSHELKNPIASLVTDGTVLLEGFRGELQPNQAEAVRKMVGKAQGVLGLVRDYLDLARIEGGELRLRPQSVADIIAAVVEPAIDLTTAQLEERNCRLVRDLPPGPLPLECDPDLLRIVLVNLLSNAGKYASEGGEVRLSLQRGDSGLMASVRNDGPGFSESERGRLFRKFSRLSSPELARRKGSGVGLYTCWRIVRLHGGRIWARSEQGRWAEFSFEIPQPLLPHTEGSQPGEDLKPLAGGR